MLASKKDVSDKWYIKITQNHKKMMLIHAKSARNIF